MLFEERQSPFLFPELWSSAGLNLPRMSAYALLRPARSDTTLLRAIDQGTTNSAVCSTVWLVLRSVATTVKRPVRVPGCHDSS